MFYNFYVIVEQEVYKLHLQRSETNHQFNWEAHDYKTVLVCMLSSVFNPQGTGCSESWSNELN